ncbi:MAG TPA: type II toxin-antitoxin system RelE/ParE family toxin [Acidobacteriota bacterium]
MTPTLRTLRAASEEFAAAVAWYEEQRPGLGADFFDEVGETTARILAYPEIGTPISPDKRTRRLLVSRFPYQVVYRLRDNEIIVVAVAHLNRRPDYWKGRI